MVGWEELPGKEKNRIIGGIVRCAAALKSLVAKEKLYLLPMPQGDYSEVTSPMVFKAGISVILYVWKYRWKTASKPDKVHGLTGKKIMENNRNKKRWRCMCLLMIILRSQERKVFRLLPGMISHCH